MVAQIGREHEAQWRTLDRASTRQATVRADDFRGIRHVEARLGDDFVAGIVLYTGQKMLPFGPKNLAVPISALWELG